MQISTKFAVAIHIVLAVETFSEKYKVTSDFIASSVKTNPVVIRKIMGRLKDSGLISITRGPGGANLAKPPEQISLLDIYESVEENKRIMSIHTGTEKACPVGGNIETLLTPFFSTAEKSLKEELSRITLSDLLEKLKEIILFNNK